MKCSVVNSDTFLLMGHFFRLLCQRKNIRQNRGSQLSDELTTVGVFSDLLHHVAYSLNLLVRIRKISCNTT